MSEPGEQSGLARRLNSSRLFDALLPFFATILALVVGAVLLTILGVNPLTAYGSLLRGAFGTVSGFTQTLAKSTPLLLVALGICIAFRGGVINIGGEGQIIIGAVAAAAVALALPTLPGVLLVPLTLGAGVAGGAVWGGIAGVLKARFGVNEILSTVMLNAIALQLMNFLLRGPMLDPEQIAAGTNIPQSATLPDQVWLLRLVPRTLLHAGLVLAVILAVVVFIFLWRTTIGFRIRAVGLNPSAARYAGIPVRRYMALALILSGAFAGLAGAVEVTGVHHRMIEGLSGGYGFSGIVAALFGKLHPLGAIPASIIFGGLLVGADKMQRTVQVPSSLVVAINGLIVLFVVASDYFVRRRALRRVAPVAPTAEISPVIAPQEAAGD
ncbi:MAG: ABC transporter permease [Anaerolineae bacterium]|uniref:ABC transporter permease n=1 Tax=Candidatus Amarolinea dominans TaxID=3140696 RepID=UPI001D47BE42|nr:ABC transporter permease [Anaerolineae bacterium]MBK9231491.1 ABC transporter permease [Anaerolineae bacterium]